MGLVPSPRSHSLWARWEPISIPGSKGCSTLGSRVWVMRGGRKPLCHPHLPTSSIQASCTHRPCSAPCDCAPSADISGAQVLLSHKKGHFFPSCFLTMARDLERFAFVAGASTAQHGFSRGLSCSTGKDPYGTWFDGLSVPERPSLYTASV